MRCRFAVLAMLFMAASIVRCIAVETTPPSSATPDKVWPMCIECRDTPGGLHLLEDEFLAEVIDPQTGEEAKLGLTAPRTRSFNPGTRAGN